MLDCHNIDVEAILRRYDIEQESNVLPENIIVRMLPTDMLLKDIARSVTNLRFREVSPAVMRALQMNMDPIDIINNALTRGMEIVSHLYSKRLYHLPEVMMAARVMEIGISLAEKRITGERTTKGRVVMHVAEGDPHDIGKNIAAVMLRSCGYDVIDMGKDVPAKEVVECVKRNGPIMVSGTALMTTTMSAFPRISELLAREGIDIPFMVAGGAVNRDFAESFPMGIYSRKAPDTPPIADRIREGCDWKTIRSEWDVITGGSA